jgi:hypothetical protein
MAQAELHIHINHPIDMGLLDGLIEKAVSAQMEGEGARTVVPTGYRCASCFRSDGGHEASCEVGTKAVLS